jgi:hypothetical protein
LEAGEEIPRKPDILSLAVSFKRLRR